MLARLYEAREVAEQMGGEEPADNVAKSMGKDALDVLELGRTFSKRFFDALNDDFNTSQAVAHAFELARAINRLANHKKSRKRCGPVVAPALEALAQLELLGLMKMDGEAFQDEVKAKRLASMGVDRDHVEALIEARAAARLQGLVPRRRDPR